MNRRRIATLQAGLVLVSLFASAAVRNATIRIKVLDSETRSVSLDDNGVPKNCDPTNYDAYCHSSKTATVTNTLLVQEDDQPPFRITCAVESKWSRCVPLEKGISFDGKKEKRGIVIYYVDEEGKARKQLYTYVADTKGHPTEPAPVDERNPNSAPTETAGRASAAAASAGSPRKEVKCNFNSTPSGAEITLDGQYVGSTPSELSVSTGTHVVVVSMPGFAQWKRELTVSPGSELTVNAVLEKVQ